MIRRIRARTWISLATVVLIGLLIYLTRHEIHNAWLLLSQVNLWILALIVPIALLNYYAAGEMFMSYLRQKNRLEDVSALDQIRLALEFNFVSHVLPSGGASGVSYVTWRLVKLGVSPAKAAMAQVVRFTMGFAAFFVLLAISVLLITLDGEINRWIILVSSGLVTLMLIGAALLIYVVSSQQRLIRTANWVTKQINRLTRKFTRGRKRVLVREDTIEGVMTEISEDYHDLKRDKKLLKQPFVWGVIFTLTDVAMFFVAFWSLGVIVNPAPILIAFGLATVAGFIVVTPGGSGAYEALMVSFLAVAGVTGSVALAGILLARIIILLLILVLGYVSYQHAILTYGKPNGKKDEPEA